MSPLIEVYRYEAVEAVVAGWELLEALRRCSANPSAARAEATLRLGLERTVAECSGGKLCLAVRGRMVCTDFDLAKRVREDSVYEVLESGDLREVSGYGGEGYVKLKVPRPGWPPTIEINGVHMHRVVDVTPLQDASIKARVARVRRGMRVLDIGTGLGYTAMAAARRGAKVVTIEASQLVLWAAERNPYSSGLSNQSIVILLGDAVELVPALRDAVFDRIIHDPPRISLAGDLYSLDFYRELYRVLKPGGLLYHYTGEPGRHSNVNILRGVKERLSRAGFVAVQYVEEAQGFLARKPRR